MPKMKTNKMAAKKLRVMKSGRVKRAQANTSHLSASKPRKRIRNLRKIIGVDATNLKAVQGMLPGKGVKS